mmetsp:Transcript_65065/g.173465  ORF Transcript_65065/g.173465 Transcript_65065/m.173465 type:complete len:271 (-) Transcript_65065:184-996(-)
MSRSSWAIESRLGRSPMPRTSTDGGSSPGGGPRGARSGACKGSKTTGRETGSGSCACSPGAKRPRASASAMPVWSVAALRARQAAAWCSGVRRSIDSSPNACASAALLRGAGCGGGTCSRSACTSGVGAHSVGDRRSFPRTSGFSGSPDSPNRMSSSESERRNSSLRTCARLATSFAAFLFLISPLEHRWQRKQFCPCMQPCGFQNQAHGSHSPRLWSTEPAEGKPGGASQLLAGACAKSSSPDAEMPVEAASVDSAVDSVPQLLPASAS